MRSDTAFALACMILSALFGAAMAEITDDKIDIPILEKKENADDGHASTCPDALILAYTDDDKYVCECMGMECPCTKTEDILSELG